MADYNAVNIENLAQALRENNDKIKSSITGKLSDLATIDKSSLVAAINEVKESVAEFKRTIANILDEKYDIIIEDPSNASLQEFVDAIDAITVAGHHDTDALAQDLIEGKTAYAYNGKITGTLKDRPDKLNASAVRKKEDGSGIYVGIEPGAYRNRETGYNPEIYIPNSQIASCIGLRPEYIAKGNSVLGIEGIIQGGADLRYMKYSLGIPMKIRSGYTHKEHNATSWHQYTYYKIPGAKEMEIGLEAEVDLTSYLEFKPKFMFITYECSRNSINPDNGTYYEHLDSYWNGSSQFYPVKIDDSYEHLGTKYFYPSPLNRAWDTRNISGGNYGDEVIDVYTYFYTDTNKLTGKVNYTRNCNVKFPRTIFFGAEILTLYVFG